MVPLYADFTSRTVFINFTLKRGFKVIHFFQLDSTIVFLLHNVRIRIYFQYMYIHIYTSIHTIIIDVMLYIDILYTYCLYIVFICSTIFTWKLPLGKSSEAFPAVPGVGAPSIVDGRQQWGSDQVRETQAWQLMDGLVEVEVSETKKLMEPYPWE